MREYDVVVFGATGVTGKLIVEELSLHAPLTIWAIAGRSHSKLKSVLREVQEITGINLHSVDIIVADITDPNDFEQPSLQAMCKKTKLVLNCVGPYRFFGEAVVRTCIVTGTDYIDVSGEPEFLERIQYKYNAPAQYKQVYVIGACGFDSLPCDLAVEFLKDKFLDGPSITGPLNSIETYLKFYDAREMKINYTTWLSAIYGLANEVQELTGIREKLKERVFPKEFPKFAFPLKARWPLFQSEVNGEWCVPFLGSDRSVIFRTQMFKYNYSAERPAQVRTYLSLPSFWHALLFLFMALIFKFLAVSKFGRNLLAKYPEVFSCGMVTKKPPTRDQVTSGSFSILLNGSGWSFVLKKDNSIPDKEMNAIVSGFNPYVATASCAVAACLTVLDDAERKKMPNVGGVFTPGAAFTKSMAKLIRKLHGRDLFITLTRETQLKAKSA